MSALAPIVEGLTKKRLPKPLAILLVYGAALVVLGALVTIIVRPLVIETNNLINYLPRAIENVVPPVLFDRTLLQQELSHLFGNAFTFTLTVASTLLGFISLVFLTFYLLLDRERIYKMIIALFPDNKEKIAKMIKKIELRLGAWLRGQIILSFIIGALSYLLYFALGIPYALPLAIFAGFMEVVPVMGPIISAVPPFVIAVLISPPTAALSLLGALAIQQAENHLIVPQVMRRAVGLNPLIVILAITIGGKLLGISGALLAVPIVVVIHIFLEEYLSIDLSSSTGTSDPVKRGV